MIAPINLSRRSRRPSPDRIPRSPAPARRIAPLLACVVALVLVPTAPLAAQLLLQPSAPTPALPDAPELPDAPGVSSSSTQQTDPQTPGSISGIVTDRSGAAVTGAQITLTTDLPSTPRVELSEPDGRFTFLGLPPGLFHVAISAPGLSAWSWSGTLDPGQALVIPHIALEIPAATTNIEVRAALSEVATAQVELEEKQRVLGVFPNFYAVYLWNAAPLTSKQKFQLAWRSSIDPVTIGVTGLVAGIQQATDSFKGYGQGAQGYGKRFGANYADGFIGTVIGAAILPSLLHQDPRYFVKGTGSIHSRALYAIASPVICRGDNGRWQPNYSNVVGNVISASISNAYYPATDRNGASLTIENSLIGTASGAISSLIQEFLLRKMTPHVPNYGAGKGDDPEQQPSPSPHAASIP